jgi:hypothetical protein
MKSPFHLATKGILSRAESTLMTQLLLALVFLPSLAFSQLVDVSSQLALETNHFGGYLGAGVSFVDFTGDYIDDLTFANFEGDLKFYQGTGAGFIPVDLNLPSHPYEAKMVLWGDIDNDGDRDLFVGYRLAPNRFYLNNGNAGFTEIASASGLDQYPSKSYGAAFGDYDTDGFLDLHISNYTSATDDVPFNEFYRNLGSLSLGNTIFSDVAEEEGVTEFGIQSFQSMWVDFNEDDLLDLHIIRDRTIYANQFYEQQPPNALTSFEESASDFGLDIMINCMSGSVADVDHNGYQDIYLTAFAADGNWLLLNDEGDFSIEHPDLDFTPNDSVQVNDVCWGANWLDVDNNGYEDLHVATGFSVFTNYPEVMSVYTDHPDRLFYNDGGAFTSAGSDFSDNNVLSFATAVGDFNMDGFPDLVSNRVGQYAQMLQGTPNENHWIKVTTEGTVSNYDGIGAKIYVWAGGEMQYHVRFAGESYLGQNSAWEHFGLGSATAIDSVVVAWPSGIVNALYDVALDEHIVVIEDGGFFYPFTADCPEPCLGCTYEEACNYNDVAMEDDGSCDFSCHTDPGMCGFGTVWDAELLLCVLLPTDDPCPNDLNGDGNITIGDLLILLTDFNQPCP